MQQISVFSRLHPGLQKIVREKGWKKGLSEIQLKAIPTIMDSQDCIIEAPTAGGKTEAVLFPTLSRAAKNKKKSVQILYLAPLRALLNNIEKRAEEYSIACGLHSFKWHGDVDQKKKILEFNNPSQLLLTTPESLEAILLRKAGWKHFFSELESVIIDEAHNFASGNRGVHISSLLERLEKSTGRHFQRIALTATLGNPQEMLNWLAGSSRKPGTRIYASLNKEVEKDFLIKYFNDSDKDDLGAVIDADVRQLNALYRLLPQKKSIIFRESRKKTEELAAQILKRNQRIKTRNPVLVRTHHSSVSKFYREEAEKLIQIASESGLHAIISTSTLELGIDIGELDQVIQVGPLVSSSAFLQRVGRTGRRRNKKQFFRGFCTSIDDLLLLTAVVSLGLKGISESINFPHKAFDILAHQLICLSLQNNGISKVNAWETISDANCFSGITVSHFNELVQTMIQKDYLRDVDGELVVGEICEKKFLGLNWKRLFATFDSAPIYEVMEGKNHVGNLDASFIQSVTLPFLFVLGGIEWKAEKIIDKLRQVIAIRTTTAEAPRWFVTGVGFVPRETAKEVGRIIFGNDIFEFLDKEAASKIDAERESHRSMNWDTGKWVIRITNPANPQIWTFAGSRINLTLALLLEEKKIGEITSDYKYIEIKAHLTDSKFIQQSIAESLESLASMEHGQLMKLGYRLASQISRKAFSKFSDCLPDQLWTEEVAESAIDMLGLKDEIKNNTLTYQ